MAPPVDGRPGRFRPASSSGTGLLVIVRGPLGAGKTTVARQLASRLGGEYVSIDRILEDHDLERWEDGFISESSFLAANRYAAAVAEPALVRGRPVVVDGNFYWRRVIDDLIGRFAGRSIVLTLDVPLATCIERDAGRPVSLGSDAARDVYGKVTSFSVGEAIDATGTIENVVDTAIALVRRRGLHPPR